MSGNTTAQSTRKNVSHWIEVSLLDAGDIKPPGVINNALDYEASVTIMRHVKLHSYTCKKKKNLRRNQKYPLRSKTARDADGYRYFIIGLFTGNHSEQYYHLIC